jgi:hypothetical protein
MVKDVLGCAGAVLVGGAAVALGFGFGLELSVLGWTDALHAVSAVTAASAAAVMIGVLMFSPRVTLACTGQDGSRWGCPH